MQALDIAVEDERWDQNTLAKVALKSVAQTLHQIGQDPERAEITILACDDERIAELNSEFRDKPKPTNVLSWPSVERGARHPGGEPMPPEAGPDGLFELGDIAISYDTCLREALAGQKAFLDHVTHLIVHATLHLLGYDHETEPDAALMERLEVKILGKLGLDDPYKDI